MLVMMMTTDRLTNKLTWYSISDPHFNTTLRPDLDNTDSILTRDLLHACDDDDDRPTNKWSWCSISDPHVNMTMIPDLDNTDSILSSDLL